jgi:hypothetical protein
MQMYFTCHKRLSSLHIFTMYAFLIPDPNKLTPFVSHCGLAGFCTFCGIKLSVLVLWSNMQTVISHLHSDCFQKNLLVLHFLLSYFLNQGEVRGSPVEG